MAWWMTWSCVPSHRTYLVVVGPLALHNRVLPACPLPSASLLLPTLSAGVKRRKKGWKRSAWSCWAQLQWSQCKVLEPKSPIREVPCLSGVNHWLGATCRKVCFSVNADKPQSSTTGPLVSYSPHSKRCVRHSHGHDRSPEQKLEWAWHSLL